MYNGAAMFHAVVWYCPTLDVYYGGELNHDIVVLPFRMQRWRSTALWFFLLD